MIKKKASSKTSSVAFSLEDLKKILFTKDDAVQMEQRMRLQFATKSDWDVIRGDIKILETKLDGKPDIEEVQRIVNLEMNKAAEVMHLNLKERDEKLSDHEERIVKLETAAST